MLTDDELAALLGETKPIWDRTVAELKAAIGDVNEEWKCYSKKSGWTLRLLQQDRAIVYLTPAAGSFNVGFSLGDKAMAAARDAGVPEALLSGKRYVEGTPVRLTMIDSANLPLVLQLAAIKMGARPTSSERPAAPAPASLRRRRAAT